MTTTNPDIPSRRSEFASDFRESSASSPTGSDRTITSQAEMKEKIFREFQRAIFIDDLTAQGAPLQASLDDVQTVLDHLRDQCNLTHVTMFSGGTSTPDNPRLPPRGFRVEKLSYEPFTHFLNIIIRAIKECLTSPRYLETLHFYPHDAQMLDKLDSEKALKPDILGLLHSPQVDQISWNDVSVFIEVKADTADMIKQLATYARTHLSLNRRRSFSIGIAFNRKGMFIQFLCFHRSGISTSSKLFLREEDGFRSVIKHMVGLLSIKDEEEFGLDMTRVNDVYRLNGRDYKIMRTIQMRDSIRGHATVVYSLQRQTAVLSVPSLRSRELTRIGTSPLPEKLVYKLSYQSEEHPSEGHLFTDFLGQFGVIDIIGYHTCTLLEPFGSTAHLFSNPHLWQPGQQTPVVASPEYKYLHCTAMELEGLPLLNTLDPEVGIPTPAELVETIFHAMIGHFNLFIGGVLHRDVSSGNILHLQTPIERSPGPSVHFLGSFLDDDTDLVLCRGFLIDGDHAIRWRDHVTATLTERSGTLPFMSDRLLRSLAKKSHVLHTAVDDLESFIWVLVWSLTYILKWAANITNEHSTIHQMMQFLSSQTFYEIIARESTAVAHWPDKVFKDLLVTWLQIAMKSRDHVDQLAENLHIFESSDDSEPADIERVLDDIDEYCRVVYKEYLQAGFKYLRTIGVFSDWAAVVHHNGNSLHK